MDKLPVTQADRDAAAYMLTSPYDGSPIQATQDMIRSGKLDGHLWVQAFAAHRLAQIKALREALEGVLPYVLTNYFRCNGDKCRHPTCESCCGEDFAESQSDKANLALTKAKAAIAALQEQSK
jgi:hypothetical protein